MQGGTKQRNTRAPTCCTRRGLPVSALHTIVWLILIPAVKARPEWREASLGALLRHFYPTAEQFLFGESGHVFHSFLNNCLSRFHDLNCRF